VPLLKVSANLENTAVKQVTLMIPRRKLKLKALTNATMLPMRTLEKTSTLQTSSFGTA